MRLGEAEAAPRISDLPALVASTAGKIELETLSDEMPEERVVDRLLARAIHNVFARWLDVDDLDEMVEAFEAGSTSKRATSCARRDYVRWMRETPGLDEAVGRLGGSNGSAAVTASAIEFVLEGLHLNRRLNKDRIRRRRPLPALSRRWTRPDDQHSCPPDGRAGPYRYARWDGPPAP